MNVLRKKLGFILKAHEIDYFSQQHYYHYYEQYFVNILPQSAGDKLNVIIN